MMLMKMDSWQIISRDVDDTFGIIRGDATYLSTVELPYVGGLRASTANNDISFGVHSAYESCIFTKDGSNVLARYRTKAEAEEGHRILAKKYNLK